MGVSKKTLDDYHMLVRVGKKAGFDFDAQFGQRIGLLRAFVRTVKEKGKKVCASKEAQREVLGRMMDEEIKEGVEQFLAE